MSAPLASCSPGFTGIDCSTDINECEGVNCSGSGACKDLVNGFFCDCDAGFVGDFCEAEIDQCSPNPCKNGGTCEKQGSTFKCECTAEFQGSDCAVAKPPRQFSCQIRLDNEFNPSYNEISSPESLALISELNRVFVPFFQKRFQNFLEIIFKRFFQGSIGMDFDILFRPTSNVSNTSIVEAFVEGNRTKELASLTILGGITVTEQLPATQSTVQSPSAVPAESDKLETWIIVLIVTGIVILALLVIIAVLTVAYRREADRGKQDMLPTDSFSELRRLEHDTMPAHAGHVNGHAALHGNKTPITTNALPWYENETYGHVLNEAYLDDGVSYDSAL